MPPTPSGYSTIARLLHWSVGLLVVVQILAGITMTSEPLADWVTPIYIGHKGLGAVILVLVFARGAWRIGHPPPPFPDYMPALEQRIAHATHLAIYGALVVMAVSGYVHVVGGGFPIELLDALGVPPLIPEVPRLAHWMLVVHQFAVVVLVALVAVHVSAVLRHHMIEGNPVLGRMWPPIQRQRDE